MPKALVRQITSEDVLYIADNLSEINREELVAITNVSPVLALSLSCDNNEAYTVVDEDGSICGAFGIMPEKNVSGAAAIWMVTTNNIKNVAMSFIRGSKEWIEKFNDRFPVIFCRVYSKNSFTRRWLELMGFDHSADIDGLGLHGESFVEYFRIKQQAREEVE